MAPAGSYFLTQFGNITLPLIGKAYGPVLQVVVQHQPPLVFVDDTKAGQARYSGAFIDLLPTLLTYAGLLNNTVTSWSMYDVSPYNQTTARITSNGTNYNAGSQAIIDELNSGRADFSLYPTPVTSSTSQYLDISSAIVDTGQAIMVVTDPQTLGPEVFLLPFDGNLWQTLILTMFGMALLLMVLDRFAKLGRRDSHSPPEDQDPLSVIPLSRASSGVPTSPVSPSPGPRPSLRAAQAPAQPKKRTTHLFETWFCFTQNVKVPREGAWSVQLVYVILCLFCFVIFQAYQASLNSLLTTTRAASNINSLTDLYSSNYAFGVVSGSVAQSYFLTSTDFLAQAMRGNMLVCNDMDDCVHKLRFGNISAVLNYRMLLQAYIASNSACDLGIVGSDFTPGNFALGLPRNSSLTWKLNIGIQQARDSGKAAAIYRTWLSNSRCSTSTTQQNSAASFALDLQHVLYPYLVLVTIFGMAILWVLFDFALLAVLLRYPNLRRYNPALLWRRYTRRRITSLPRGTSTSNHQPWPVIPTVHTCTGAETGGPAARSPSVSGQQLGAPDFSPVIPWNKGADKGGQQPVLIVSASAASSVESAEESGSHSAAGTWVGAASPVAAGRGPSVTFSEDLGTSPTSPSVARGPSNNTLAKDGQHTQAGAVSPDALAEPASPGAGASALAPATATATASPVLPFINSNARAPQDVVPHPPTSPPPAISPSPRAASLLPVQDAAPEQQADDSPALALQDV